MLRHALYLLLAMHSLGEMAHHSREPAPPDTANFAAMMSRRATANVTLLDYCFPQAPQVGRVEDHWAPFTSGCRVATDCYCFHVEGDMSRARNPDGWMQCAKLSTVGNC